MERFDPLGTTVPAHPAPPPPTLPGPRRIGRRVLVPAAVAGTGVVALVIGILIGRGCRSEHAPAVAAPAVKLAQLVVTSKPVDANVLVDGRFVGVSPVERVDLEAGKHSVVIDAFGFQPYAGTLEIDPEARMTLKVTLAPIGGGGATNGEFAGRGGKGSNLTVPASALLLSGTGASKDAPKAPKPAGGRSSSSSSSSSYTPPPPPVYEPPPRPRRDCGGEKSQCRDHCSRANTDCRFNCPHCVTCSSSVGTEECRRQCEQCRSGCEQNVKFCESSCESNYSSCQASQ